MVGSEADPAIISQRVEGAAHTCYLRKAPLKQATPLTVPLVKRLEGFVLEGNDIYAVIAGFAPLLPLLCSPMVRCSQGWWSFDRLPREPVSGRGLDVRA